MTNRTLEALLWGTLATYVGACALAWPYLPERMPLHFGFTGEVTSWAETSVVSWFLPPALCVGLVLLVRAASGPPEAWNLPREDVRRFHALPEDAQSRIRTSARRSTLLALVCIPIVFVGLQLAIYLTAVRRAQNMPAYLSVLLLGPVVLLLVLGGRDRSRLRRSIRAAAEEQQVPVSNG